MELIHKKAAGRPPLSTLTRFRRFMIRSAAMALLTAAVLATMQHQATLVIDEERLDHPLDAALKAVGASVQQTEVAVWAKVPPAVAPGFAEMKVLADGVAANFSPDSRRGFWTDEGRSYRVVYIEGREERGGSWLASARYVDGDWPRIHTAEIALYRLIHGTEPDIRGLLEWGKGQLRRAAPGVISDLEHQVKISARPQGESDPSQLAASILAAAGADLRFTATAEDQWTAGGYSPRLPGRTTVGNHEVNIVVNIARHGRGNWIEVGYPRL